MAHFDKLLLCSGGDLQGRAELEHNSQIVKPVLRLHAKTSSPDIY